MQDEAEQSIESMSVDRRSDRRFDEDFAEELEQLQYYSHGDYVEVEIVHVRNEDGTAHVHFDPPVGRPFCREMDVPHDPSARTEFTRLLDELGHNFDTAPEMIGDRVDAKYTDDGWEIQYKTPKIPRGERMREKVQLLATLVKFTILFIVWPIGGVIAIGLMDIDVADDDETGTTTGDAYSVLALGYMVVLVIWFIFATAVVIPAIGMLGVALSALPTLIGSMIEFMVLTVAVTISVITLATILSLLSDRSGGGF